MKLLMLVHHRLDLWNTPAWFPQKLMHDFPQVEVVSLDSYDSADEQLREAEIVMTWSLRPEQFAAAHKLRWVHSPAAAVHLFMFPEFIESDVLLTNAREVHGPVVAEQVIAMVLALAKLLPQDVRFQLKHEWGQAAAWRAKPRIREVAGATLALIGLGTIGRETATRGAALGMRVIGVRENPQKGAPAGVQEVFPITRLDDVLSQSDYVVLSVPVTPETRGLMNAARLSRMKPDACLINVGRGPVIEEAALAEALREHKIGGAALDVFDEEPLPAASPFWDLENLLITPHTAGMTEKLWERHYVLLSENLRRYLRGQPLLGMVDKKRGY